MKTGTRKTNGKSRELPKTVEEFRACGTDYGCSNCLFQSVECNGEKYKPRRAWDGTPGCEGYSYCD